MTSPQYGYAPVGGINYFDAMNNKFLQAAMMAPNPNFKASQTSQSQAADAVQSAANDGAIPVVPQAGVQEASAGGSNFVTGVLATALIGGGALWMLKSGKFSKAEKAFKSLIGKGEGETATTTVLTKLRAIKNGNGELKVQVPNKTKTFAGNHVNAGVTEYGIKPAIAAERQVFNPQVSKLRGFQVDTPIGRYTVFVKDGQISKVIEGHKDVTEQFAQASANSTDSILLERFKKVAAELGKDTKEVDKSVLKDVVNIGYVNKYGDDTLKLTMGKYGETPQLKAFNTLKQFSKDDVAVMQYKPSSSERIFAGDLVKKTGWINQKGVLAEGLEVIRCEENIAGAKCFFENGKLVKILKGGNEYTAESLGFDKFVKANEKAIDSFKKDVFEDRIADKIPNGALIGTV